MLTTSKAPLEYNSREPCALPEIRPTRLIEIGGVDTVGLVS
jgi:hypothetical protein